MSARFLSYEFRIPNHELWRVLQFLFGLVLVLCLTTACERTSIQSATLLDSNCRPVQHVMGESCIPLQPQRVVTLDGVSLEYALALGIQPVGSVLDQLDQHLIEQVSHQGNQIENIGTAGAPNLEKILQLKPDLILGLDFHQPIYSEIARIAPVVVFEFQYSGRWKELFQTFAASLGQSDVAQQVLDRYDQRINQLKQTLANPLPTVSVIRIDPASINVYFKDSFCGVILQDAGLPRPPAQNLSATEAQQTFNNPIQAVVNQERLDLVNGDVIFTWIGENMLEATQDAQAQIDKLKTDPLWQKLPAVQQNRVYYVPSYWIGSGPISANLVVDDLFKYLISDLS